MSPEDIMLNYFFHEPNYNCKCNPEYLDLIEVPDHSEKHLSIYNRFSDTLCQNAAHPMVSPYPHGYILMKKEN